MITYYIPAGSAMFRRKAAATVEEREWELVRSTKAVTFTENEVLTGIVDPAKMGAMEGVLARDNKNFLFFNLPTEAFPYVQISVSRSVVTVIGHN